MVLVNTKFTVTIKDILEIKQTVLSIDCPLIGIISLFRDKAFFVELAIVDIHASLCVAMCS